MLGQPQNQDGVIWILACFVHVIYDTVMSFSSVVVALQINPQLNIKAVLDLYFQI